VLLVKNLITLKILINLYASQTADIVPPIQMVMVLSRDITLFLKISDKFAFIKTQPKHGGNTLINLEMTALWKSRKKNLKYFMAKLVNNNSSNVPKELFKKSV